MALDIALIVDQRKEELLTFPMGQHIAWAQVAVDEAGGVQAANELSQLAQEAASQGQ